MAKNIIEDRVHPGPGGHLIMAEALLKAWNAPATVAAVEIDAAAGRVVRADNAKITGLKAGSTLSWTETDGALPMPVDMEDKATALSVRSSDFIAALDQEPLKVTGLAAARYTPDDRRREGRQLYQGTIRGRNQPRDAPHANGQAGGQGPRPDAEA